MTLNTLLNLIGAGSLFGYGLASIIKPHWVARVLDIDLNSRRGISEFSVAHGGSVMGLALAAFFLNQPLVFQTLGWSCIGAAVVRLIAYLRDRPKINVIYLAFFVTEWIAGIFLLL